MTTTLTTQQVSQLLGVHVKTVQRYVQRKKLKPAKSQSHKRGVSGSIPMAFKEDDVLGLPQMKDLLTVGDAYELLFQNGVTQAKRKSGIEQVRRLAVAGKIPSIQHRLNRYRLFRKKDVVRYGKDEDHEPKH
jgi:excisionase family DNA binding protein